MKAAALRLGVALGFLMPAFAGLADPALGIDFRQLASPQPVRGARVEVIEFFWYRCPHCYEFEPLLKRWAAKLPADVRVTRVPVVFNAEWAIDARIFYALQAMGEEGRLRRGLYDAIHLEGGRRLDREQYQRWVEAWLSGRGVDIARFRAAVQSKAVEEQVDQAKLMTLAYGIEGTPTLAIDGRYIVGADSGSQTQMLAVTTYLIDKARRRALSSH